MEEIQRVEENGKQIDEMVAQIIGDRLDTINAYISDVRTLYLTGQEILDDDLAKISLRIFSSTSSAKFPTKILAPISCVFLSWVERLTFKGRLYNFCICIILMAYSASTSVLNSMKA